MGGHRASAKKNEVANVIRNAESFNDLYRTVNLIASGRSTCKLLLWFFYNDCLFFLLYYIINGVIAWRCLVLRLIFLFNLLLEAV